MTVSKSAIEAWMIDPVTKAYFEAVKADYQRNVGGVSAISVLDVDSNENTLNNLYEKAGRHNMTLEIQNPGMLIAKYGLLTKEDVTDATDQPAKS